jgi:hypothetical protein
LELSKKETEGWIWHSRVREVVTATCNFFCLSCNPLELST